MYFVTFSKDGEERLGVCDAPGGRILDVRGAQERLRQQGNNDGDLLPSSLLELIDIGDEAVEVARGLFESAAGVEDVWFAEEDVKLCAPIPRPRKNVYAIGLNYRAHNEEFTGGTAVSQYPIVFTKTAGSVVGPEDAIESHQRITESVDYEAELAVVIGKAGRDIPAERAEEHIFGYTIINDVTARDLQKRTSQWFVGKSLDTFCPMGPYVAHKSLIEWPVTLDIRSRVNGEVRQSSNTRLLIFSIPELIRHLSQGMTLEPGDIIATGTCEGVGMGFDPPRFLKSGDVVEVEIEKLGRLRNSVA